MIKFLKTKEEISKYFDGDKIQCLICGKWFKMLSVHLNKAHNMSVDQYKKQFGLPWTKGLCGSATRNKYRDNAERLRAEGLLLTGIISEEHEKKVHKKGHKRITPLQSKFLSQKMKKLGDKNAYKHLDLEICKKLKAKGLNQIEIAAYFGVGQMTISRFVRGLNKYQRSE